VKPDLAKPLACLCLTFFVCASACDSRSPARDSAALKETRELAEQQAKVDWGRALRDYATQFAADATWMEDVHSTPPGFRLFSCDLQRTLPVGKRIVFIGNLEDIAARDEHSYFIRLSEFGLMSLRNLWCDIKMTCTMPREAVERILESAEVRREATPTGLAVIVEVTSVRPSIVRRPPTDSECQCDAAVEVEDAVVLIEGHGIHCRLIGTRRSGYWESGD
jgi:hypothetical protein